MQEEILFSLSEMRTQKINTQESKERRFVEKVKKKRVSSSNIYKVVFAFLFELTPKLAGTS